MNLNLLNILAAQSADFSGKEKSKEQDAGLENGAFASLIDVPASVGQPLNGANNVEQLKAQSQLLAQNILNNKPSEAVQAFVPLQQNLIQNNMNEQNPISLVVSNVLQRFETLLADDTVRGNVVENINQVLNQHNLPANLKEALSQIVDKLQPTLGNAGIVAQASGNVSVADNTIGDALQAIDIQNISPTQEKHAIQSIASEIIAQVKQSLANADISHTNIHSVQTTTLLQSTKQDQVKDKLDSAFVGSAQQPRAQTGGGALQNTFANGDTQLSSGQSLSAGNVGAQSQQQGSMSEHKGGQSAQLQNVQTTSEVLLQGQGAGSELKGDILKFEQYMKLSDAQHNQPQAKEVLAQIKFGASTLAANGTKQITIQLYPKELGSVDIRMELGNEGKSRVMVIAERTDTLNLLQKEADNLKTMLTDALKTNESQLSFSFHDKNDQNFQQFAQQHASNAMMQGNESEQELTPTSGYDAMHMTASEGINITV